MEMSNHQNESGSFENVYEVTTAPHMFQTPRNQRFLSVDEPPGFKSRLQRN
jgi:hypothetical protein